MKGSIDWRAAAIVGGPQLLITAFAWLIGISLWGVLLLGAVVGICWGVFMALLGIRVYVPAENEE